MLRAFKHGDPNGNGEADEIPLSFRTFGWLGVYPLFSSFGVDRQHHLGEEMGISIDRDDPTRVIYVAASDAYRDGIEYFHGLYSEGLIDIEAFSHSYAELTAKQRQLDPPILGSFTAWSAALPVRRGGGQRLRDHGSAGGARGPALAGRSAELLPQRVHGHQRLGVPAGGGALGRPAVTTRPGRCSRGSGIIGTHILDKGDGTYVHAEIPDGFESRISWKNQSVPRGMGIYALPVEVMRLMEPTADQLDKFAGNEQYAPYIASYVRFPLVYMLEEENDEIADLAPEINQFTQEMGARWIVDGGIEEDWEGYLQRLDSMGLPRLLEIYQKVYDRHLSGLAAWPPARRLVCRGAAAAAPDPRASSARGAHVERCAGTRRGGPGVWRTRRNHSRSTPKLSEHPLRLNDTDVSFFTEQGYLVYHHQLFPAEKFRRLQRFFDGMLAQLPEDARPGGDGRPALRVSRAVRVAGRGGGARLRGTPDRGPTSRCGPATSCASCPSAGWRCRGTRTPPTGTYR